MGPTLTSQYLQHEARLRKGWIPAGATPVDPAGTDAAVYTYDGASDGRPGFYALAFHGKAQKPDFHLRFRTAEARAEYVAKYLAGRRAHAAFVAERKAARSQPHALKVGDLLHTSWGYDQTNVEFYEVTRVVGPRTVELREVAQARTETGWCRGNCTPVAGKYIGAPIVRRVRAGEHVSVRIDDVRDAWPGGGEHRWSSYA